MPVTHLRKRDLGDVVFLAGGEAVRLFRHFKVGVETGVGLLTCLSLLRRMPTPSGAELNAMGT